MLLFYIHKSKSVFIIIFILKAIKLNIVLQYLKYRIYQDYQTIGIFLFNAAVFKGDEVIETLPHCDKVSINIIRVF